MLKNNSWESLIWIIIGVFILSFIILWVSNLLINNIWTINSYENKRDISILTKNTTNIIQKIDTTMVNETEIFYLYKNNTNKNFEIKTWSWNYEYKYIDKYWNKIEINDLALFPWNIYSRVLWLEREDTSQWEEHQVIKASIKRLIKK